MQVHAPFIDDFAVILRSSSTQCNVSMPSCKLIQHHSYIALNIDMCESKVVMLPVLQGIHIPRLLGHGQIHEGLHAFTAMSAGGTPLSPDLLRSCPAIAEHAMCALKAMHQQNMLHGDIALQNFVTSGTAQSVWLVDLVNACPGTAAETAREQQVLRRLLKCMSL